MSKPALNIGPSPEERFVIMNLGVFTNRGSLTNTSARLTGELLSVDQSIRAHRLTRDLGSNLYL